MRLNLLSLGWMDRCRPVPQRSLVCWFGIFLCLLFELNEHLIQIPQVRSSTAGSFWDLLEELRVCNVPFGCFNASIHSSNIILRGGLPKGPRCVGLVSFDSVSLNPNFF